MPAECFLIHKIEMVEILLLWRLNLKPHNCIVCNIVYKAFEFECYLRKHSGLLGKAHWLN